MNEKGLSTLKICEQKLKTKIILHITAANILSF
jgi:hypothetical protein